MYCICCHAPITRGELLVWSGRCDDCAALADDLTPDEQIHAAHLARLALWHVRYGVPFIEDEDHVYVFEAIA